MQGASTDKKSTAKASNLGVTNFGNAQTLGQENNNNKDEEKSDGTVKADSTDESNTEDNNKEDDKKESNTPQVFGFDWYWLVVLLAGIGGAGYYWFGINRRD